MLAFASASLVQKFGALWVMRSGEPNLTDAASTNFLQRNKITDCEFIYASQTYLNESRAALGTRAPRRIARGLSTARDLTLRSKIGKLSSEWVRARKRNGARIRLRLDRTFKHDRRERLRRFRRSMVNDNAAVDLAAFDVAKIANRFAFVGLHFE
jgi:hypothetical protein